jgi:hypothetical protein
MNIVNLSSGKSISDEIIPLTIPVPSLLSRTPIISQLPVPHATPNDSVDSDIASPAPPPVVEAAIPPPPPPPLPYPALHLIPLNETFVPKQIALSRTGGKVKIGRQTNAKTVPNGANGYFDSKVLSRMHAEVWCEDDKVRRCSSDQVVSLITADLDLPSSQVFIKDVKSSNGTFINGDRLSPESTDSDIFELHSDDTVVRRLITPRSKLRD